MESLNIKNKLNSLLNINNDNNRNNVLYSSSDKYLKYVEKGFIELKSEI
jgi:hypothetical protein